MLIAGKKFYCDEKGIHKGCRRNFAEVSAEDTLAKEVSGDTATEEVAKC